MRSSADQWRWLVPLLLVAAVAAAYWPVVGHGFLLWDDADLVVENPGLAEPTRETLGRFWAGPYQALYTPLSYTLWWLVARVVGLQPAAFHATNLLLHIGCVLGVYAILRQLVAGRWPAVLGAMVFALHPIQVEAVAWVSGMNNLLAGVFALSAVGMYLRHARGGGRGWALGATALFVLAMLGKPIAAGIPLVVWIMDVLLLKRRWTRAALLPLAWVMLAIPLLVVARQVQEPQQVYVPELWQRPVVMLDAAGFYLGKIAWPAGLTVDYGRTPAWLMQSASRWWVAAVMAGLLMGAWLVRKKAPWALASAGVFVAGMLAVSGLTPFAFQRISTVADRYAYLPMLGVALAVAFACQRWKRLRVMGVAAAVVLAILSARQQAYWRDTATLFARAAELRPDSAMAQWVLGAVRARAGDAAAAEAHYRRSLELDGGYASAHYNLGNLLLGQGRVHEAVEHYEAALRQRPEDAAVHVNLGAAYAQLRQWEQAENHLRQALRVQASAEAHANLGAVLVQQGRLVEARREYEAALALRPGYELAERGLVRLDSAGK